MINLRRKEILGLLLAGLALPAMADPVDQDIVFLPDVEDQFAKIALRPEALAFRLNDSPEPNQCKHYQGVARANGMGTPYLFVTRSGNKVSPNLCGDDQDDPGNLLIVKLGSRDSTGERLRSNRLQRGIDIALTAPVAEDSVVRTILFDGNGDWPSYGHPGGMQIVGDVLVLALETPYDEGEPDNLMLFIDVSEPESPELISSFDTGPGNDYSAGLVAVTPVYTDSDECCDYIMLVTGKFNDEVRMYRSQGGGLDSPDLDWLLVGSWSEGQIEACLGGEDWHTGRGDAHQMLNFVRQGDMDGPIYVVGGRNTTLLPSGDDYVDLYRTNLDRYGTPTECLFEHVRSTQVTSKPIIGGGDSANFAAAAGTHVSPTGELIIYSTEYENDGPRDSAGRKVVRFGEWRHREIVRPGSPTLRPTVAFDGEYTVEEGATVEISGTGMPATTRAWLQLFEDDNLGRSLPPLGDKDDWLIADYADWSSDDFDDFREEDYSDDAGSWRWFAPVGCTLRANDDDFGDSNFPGKFTRTLYGTGRVEEEPDLNSVQNDKGVLSMDDEVTSMEFFANCDAYYSAAIAVSWDLDGDGTFEASGDAVTFSATELDGPSVSAVAARGEHPTDSSALGVGVGTGMTIAVRNVAPTVDDIQLIDMFGRALDTEPRIVLQGLSYRLSATFTDPGRPDTQTAIIEWGDGGVESEGQFDTFGDASGGKTGEVNHTHAFSAPGNLSPVLRVSDDDGGVDSATVDVVVVSAAGAASQAVETIQGLIDATADPNVLATLQDALAALQGNNNGRAANGAIDKIEGEKLVAAMVSLGKVIDALCDAEDEGAGDLSGLKHTLGTAAAALAQAALQSAISDGRPPPLVRRIAAAIDSGDAAMTAGDYEAAVLAYKSAV